MQNVSRTSLKKFFSSLKQDEIIDLISELCNKFPAINEYFKNRMSPKNHENNYKEYAKKLKVYLNPGPNFTRLKLREANSLIKEFGKICENKKLLINLMFFYIECCFSIIREWGDIPDSSFNKKLIEMFRNACDEIVGNVLEEEYFEQIENVYGEAIEIARISYSFSEIHKEYFE